MAAVTSAKNINQPDQEHARPDKDNFGDTNAEGESKEQVGFSRQC